jgi:hypothetical protein
MGVITVVPFAFFEQTAHCLEISSVEAKCRAVDDLWLGVGYFGPNARKGAVAVF